MAYIPKNGGQWREEPVVDKGDDRGEMAFPGYLYLYLYLLPLNGYLYLYLPSLDSCICIFSPCVFGLVFRYLYLYLTLI